MFEHILNPLDFSDENDSAVEIASRIAGHSDSKVTLLHVIEPIEDEHEDLREFFEKLENRARKKLARVAAELSADGVRVAVELTYGNRAEEIVRVATSQGVDLIVLTSHKLEAAQARPWPTISHRVALLSPVPVLLVR